MATKLPDQRGAGDVQAFLQRMAATPKAVRSGRGRLLFAMDATASRRPTWDRAAQIQTEMFTEAALHGSLEIQLCFFRGFGECRASSWIAEPGVLAQRMASVQCVAGHTQIAKVLSHAIDETKAQKIDAMAYVGDCCEEDVDRLGALAGELGLLGVPVFLFQEGHDPAARFAYGQIAKLTRGAHLAFDAASPQALRDLLKAVAAFAAGGRPALQDFARRAGGDVPLLARQIGPGT
ncbi:VWA domain-containing protein [Desertibaculum subflavum]|uniref:VWA domain-containing protein n=1 Tax=Desertibaculum subflavum TaxID=2268458 RepID=UPI000E65FABE